MNMGQIMFTHVCKCKNDTCETVLGVRKMSLFQETEIIGGGELKYDIFDTL
jgi:hypothetical protein